MKIKILAILFAIYLLPSIALASTIEPFSTEAFDNAKERGQVVLLDFYASWCSTCRAQGSALEALLKEDEFNKLVVLRVDYDSADELKDRYNVARQSTLILLKGDDELDRSMGITNEEGLRTFLRKAGTSSS